MAYYFFRALDYFADPSNKGLRKRLPAAAMTGETVMM